MKVELLGYTAPMNLGEPVEKMVTAAAKGCYSSKPSCEIMDDLDGDGYVSTLDHIVKSGHESVIEHLNFTFSIEGISRACSHQLVRHRMGSYSQESQRYVKFDKIDMVIPESIQKLISTPAGDILYSTYEARLERWLEYMVQTGVPNEDIRYFFPEGIKSNITVTMNARGLLNFFKWRCCSMAQWEIRELAEKMLELVKNIAPTIFQNAGPECLRTGCHEGKRSCHRNVKVNE